MDRLDVLSRLSIDDNGRPCRRHLCYCDWSCSSVPWDWQLFVDYNGTGISFYADVWRKLDSNFRPVHDRRFLSSIASSVLFERSHGPTSETKQSKSIWSDPVFVPRKTSSVCRQLREVLRLTELELGITWNAAWFHDGHSGQVVHTHAALLLTSKICYPVNCPV